ncbi:ATP-binding cassette transporter snq2, partial [Rhizina undulata]
VTNASNRRLKPSLTLFLWTFGEVLAVLAPNQPTAATLTILLFSTVIIFNGDLQPIFQLVSFWHWMYHLSPFTYLISGLMSKVIHDVPIICAPLEINILQPPANETCASYIAQFLDTTEMGKVYNPDATANCQYCRVLPASGHSPLLQEPLVDTGHKLTGISISFQLFAAHFTTASHTQCHKIG